MKNTKNAIIFTLLVFLILGLLGYMYSSFYRTGPFDIKEFDKKHHTAFEGSGYFYSRQMKLVPPGYPLEVCLFHGERDALAYSSITVYNTAVTVDETAVTHEFLTKKECTVHSLPAAVVLYREYGSKETACHPAFQVSFGREGYFYVLLIEASDIYTKTDTVIDDRDIAYIEQYLEGIFP